MTLATTLAATAFADPGLPATVDPAAPATAEPTEAAAPAAEVAASPAAEAKIRLPGLTVIQLRVLDPVTSKTAVAGQAVRLELAKPVYLTPELGLAEGTPVEGIVIHAAKSGMGGKAGELLIGAKRISLGGEIEIPLRSFKLGPARGQNNEGVAMAAAVAGGAIGGVAAMFITGGSAEVPAGMAANAKTSVDADIPVTLLSKLPPIPATISPPAPPAQAPVTQTSAIQGGIE